MFDTIMKLFSNYKYISHMRSTTVIFKWLSRFMQLMPILHMELFSKDTVQLLTDAVPMKHFFHHHIFSGYSDNEKLKDFFLLLSVTVKRYTENCVTDIHTVSSRHATVYLYNITGTKSGLHPTLY